MLKNKCTCIHYFSLLQNWTRWAVSEAANTNAVILGLCYRWWCRCWLWWALVLVSEMKAALSLSLCLCQDFLSTVLDVLTPEDVRVLAESEDELNRLGQFERVFPSPSSSRYLRFFECPRYLNVLLDQWEQKHWNNRTKGTCVLQCTALAQWWSCSHWFWFFFFQGFSVLFRP